MSRSYKKTPVVKDGHSGKVGKKFANRKVRRFKMSISNGKAYKKIYESYDIHDFIVYYSYEDFKRDEESHLKEVNQGVVSCTLYSSEKDWLKRYRYK